ncbi:MAG: cytochrome c biogenesis protein CcsA [Spirochaetes bacterium]|nr:cytochrome c biogenesis protein CcsA [Spirochaetota bacterium]
MIVGTNPGSIILIISLIFSIIALTFTINTAAGKESYEKPSRLLFLLASAGIAASLAVLFYYFIQCDYRLEYVYANSSRDLPLVYRVAALWAGKEGSFLLWLFFLNIFGIIILSEKTTDSHIVTSIILLAQIFILIILITESPFAYLWETYPDSFSPGLAPGDGAGLNPLLKDPWMVIHPPVLFLGYASATIPFGYAIVALLKKEFREWIRAAYPWLLFSTVTLGIGIFLGGYWAYSVLGWGGYWGWDPVENSSLIPWLVAVAMVHGFLLQKRNGVLVRTNIILALVYFVLVLYSTWLTRSGVLSNFSVHSFTASGINLFLFAFLVLFAAGALVLYLMRYKTAASERLNTAFFDWRTQTVYGIMVLILYSLIILTGTSMPIISSMIMERQAGVTESFYNNFSKPIGILILILMTASTSLIVMKRDRVFKTENILAFIASLIVGVFINFGYTNNPHAYVFSILSFFLIARALLDIRLTRSPASLPSRLTHIGVGLLVIGIITSNFHTSSVQKKLVLGKEESIGSINLAFLGFKEGKESSLQFSFSKGDTKKIIETSYYIDQKTESLYREPYIVTGFLNDIYIAPEQYESGMESITQLVLSKGEHKEFSGLAVHFRGFRTEHMRSGTPTTYADITVNGVPVAPGIAFTRDGVRAIDRIIPGTDRSVSLADLDATSKKIFLTVTPGKHIAIPPDTVFITVTRKRLIWLVWLGTLFIAGGGGYAYARTLGKK